MVTYKTKRYFTAIFTWVKYKMETKEYFLSTFSCSSLRGWDQMVAKLLIRELLVYSNLLWSHIFCKMPLFTNFSPQKMLAPHILIFRDDITDYVSKQLKIMAGCEPLLFSPFWWNGLQFFQSTEGHIENVLFIIPQFNLRLWQSTTFRAFFFRRTPEYK